MADDRQRCVSRDRQQATGVDRRRLHHVGQLPVLELTSLSSATADSNEVAFNRLVPDKKVSYIRNSVKATVDAYDGTVTLYQQDEKDPVLKAWMQVFPAR